MKYYNSGEKTIAQIQRLYQAKMLIERILKELCTDKPESGECQDFDFLMRVLKEVE